MENKKLNLTAKGPTQTKSRDVLSFEDADPDNPVNWSSVKKSLVVTVGVLCIFNSVFGTSLPSGAIEALSNHFHVRDSEQLVLPITIYQVGFVIGSVTFGPLSETCGRRYVMIGSFICFTIFTFASAWISSWRLFLAFRFIRGSGSASAVAVTGGLYADIFHDPRMRGRANALFLCVTSIAPQLAPFTSGFASEPPLDWQWPLFIATAIAGACFPIIMFLPETYAPIILQQRARKIRKQGNGTVFAPIEMEKESWRDVFLVFLARPLRMMVTELIVLLTCLYLGYATGIYYLFFEAYDTIFEGIYQLSPGVSRLMLLPVAGGSFVGFLLFFVYDRILYRARTLNKPWAWNEEYRRLPIACAGGPLCIIGLFWLGWTSSEEISYGVPAAAGFPFGLGFYFILMSLNNYLADAYKTFSASAMAAVSCSRSLGGGGLPLVSKPMYDALGVQWGTSLLGFLCLAVALTPFLFIKYGQNIRERSKFCQQLSAEEPGPGEQLRPREPSGEEE